MAIKRLLAWQIVFEYYLFYMELWFDFPYVYLSFMHRALKLNTVLTHQCLWLDHACILYMFNNHVYKRMDGKISILVPCEYWLYFHHLIDRGARYFPSIRWISGRSTEFLCILDVYLEWSCCLLIYNSNWSFDKTVWFSPKLMFLVAGYQLLSH